MNEAPAIRILIAEDEEKLAEILASYLTGRGHAVRVTSDGRAGARSDAHRGRSTSRSSTS